MHNISICCTFSPARRGRCCSSDISFGFLKEASTCRIEASLDVPFDEPFGPCPRVVDFGQGRLASPFRSESVAVSRELWFIIGFQYGAYYVLYHLWRPVWHAEWAFSTFWFVYVDSP